MKEKPITTHKDCQLARGMKMFRCFHCNEQSSNYCNGTDICDKCSETKNICRICGKPLDNMAKQ